MAVYVYSERQIESIIRATRRFRLRNCVARAAIFIGAVVVALTRSEWIFGAHKPARIWVLAALLVFIVGPLSNTLWHWRSRLIKLEQSLRRMKVEISQEGVILSRGSSVTELSRADIHYAEEVSWGLYLRTANRYRWILIPERIDGFDTLKRELDEMRIPIVEAGIPPNWEELVGALIFAGTMLCAVFVHNTSVLAANLLISLLVAGGGYFVVSANPDNLPMMRWARFGIFLPVAMTASMLWIAIRR